MESQFNLQVIGILLAVITAMGCIAYEKMVNSFSYCTVVMFVVLSYFPFFIISIFSNNQLMSDLSKIKESTSLKWSIFIFMISGATSYCWYYITKIKGVMVGGVFEMKFLLILALFYIICGTNPMTTNVIIGLIFSLLGIYFITK